MLLKRAVLDAIASGEVDLVFRRWTRPTVRAGGTLRTSVGMLDIDAVDTVAKRAITASDARRAGYGTRAALLGDLDRRPDGDIYRIAVRLGGADPLIELRSRSRLTDTDAERIRSQLAAMDDRAEAGPWTDRYLRLLAAQPKVRAQDLADSIGVDKPTFKGRVRRLKRLGLTISHSPGYELSPRGAAYLDRMTRERR